MSSEPLEEDTGRPARKAQKPEMKNESLPGGNGLVRRDWEIANLERNGRETGGSKIIERDDMIKIIKSNGLN